MTLSAAVVGAGFFSQFHLSAWAAHPDAAIVGVTDQDAARAQNAATRFGTQAVAGSDDIIALAPDIVDIVVPPSGHATLIEALSAPGRVIVCQKPFCTSLAEAQAVVAKAQAAGATVVIHENFRFQPWHRTVRRLLRDGRMGQVYQAGFWLRPGDGRGHDAYAPIQTRFRAMPRLLMHETGVHFVDLFLWLFGDVSSVYADIRRLNPHIAGEDAGFFTMDHSSGVQSLFDGNRHVDHRTDNPRRTMGEMVIEGEGGTIRLDGQGRVKWRAFGHVEEEPIAHALAVDEDSFGGGCVAALIDHVIQARLGSGSFENTAESYLRVIEITEAIYRSAAEGCRIKV